jgi:hypothetical protein
MVISPTVGTIASGTANTTSVSTANQTIGPGSGVYVFIAFMSGATSGSVTAITDSQSGTYELIKTNLHPA